MIKYKNYLTLALVSLGLLCAACNSTTVAESGKGADAVMNAEAIALGEKLIFERGGFRLNQKTQEGTTVKDRLTQDTIQKVCSALAGTPVDGDTATKVTTIARKSISKPSSGVKLGDCCATAGCPTSISPRNGLRPSPGQHIE